MLPRLTLAALLGTAIGCGAGNRSGEIPEDRRAFTTIDSWYAPPTNFAVLTPLSRERFAAGIEPLQAEAQQQLADSSVKPITAEDATRLTGKQLPRGEVYVLLRGVALNVEWGGFDVGVGEKVVSVRHGNLGTSPLPMTRRALVAVLPSLPETVYVSCSMAE